MAKKNYLNEVITLPNGRARLKRWNEKEVKVREKKKKRRISKATIFWSFLSLLSIYFRSLPALVAVILFWVVSKLPSGQAEKIKGENYCILCGARLTQEEKLAHEDFCNACYIEDLAVATIYDLPKNEI